MLIDCSFEDCMDQYYFKKEKNRSFYNPIILNMKANFFALFCFAFLLIGVQVFGQDLSIGIDDFRLEQRADAGFHLFIRKKPGIASVLLTESTRDPTMQEDNYAYRAREWNTINGDEIRLLDGAPIPRQSGIFSLIASRTEEHPEIGEAFHIFVPWIVVYGYPGGRSGELLMTDGTFINIRSFNLPYADYRGSFADNPFVLQGTQRPAEQPSETYMGEAEASFTEIARSVNGDFIYAADPAELIETIKNILQKEKGKSVDIVICLDTTGSMGRYIDSLRKMLIPMMRNIIADFTSWRIGMVLFRDYPPDVYVTKIIPFTKDFSFFQRYLNSITAWGGGDVPEAVYEALYDGADKFNFEAESRLLILAGDAPPHPVQRGLVSREMAYQKIGEKELKVNAILLPQ
jgi:hypothetical protein